MIFVGFRYGDDTNDLDLLTPAEASPDTLLSALTMTLTTRRGEWYGELTLGLALDDMVGSLEEIEATLTYEVRRALAGLGAIQALTVEPTASRIWLVSAIVSNVAVGTTLEV